ncbi:MAG: ATP synthase F1 subunit delta [Acidobacteria bacterium]|nr:ATP synthase F1 subunit delta [Acidobacteriota bacterium]
MISSAVAGRYARSLADVVFEERVEARVLEDLERFREIFAAVPDVLETFDSPAVAREAKGRLLEGLLERYPVSPVAANFLRVLLQNNRMRHFSPILDAFGKAVDARRGVVRARVTSAARLGEPELKMVEAGLSRFTGARVQVEPRTDPDLIGGCVVEIGSTVFDGSIRTRLAEVKRRLADARPERAPEARQD